MNFTLIIISFQENKPTLLFLGPIYLKDSKFFTLNKKMIKKQKMKTIKKMNRKMKENWNLKAKKKLRK